MKNNKKWLIITVISLVLFAAEIVFSILVLLPAMKTNKVVDKIAEFDSKGAASAMNDLSDSKKDTAKEKVRDLIVKKTNDYIAGKVSYDELKKLLIAVENVEDFYGMSEECFKQANKLELKKALDTVASEGIDDQAIREIYFIIAEGVNAEGQTENIRYLEYFEKESQADYQKQIADYFDELLKLHYEAYKNGSYDGAKVLAEAGLIKDNFYLGDVESTYASDIKEELQSYEAVKSFLDDMEAAVGREDYNQAINLYNQCLDNHGSKAAYSEFKAQLDAVKDKAVTDGTAYYNKKFEEYRQAKDKDSAVKLYEEIKANFGTEIAEADALAGFNPIWVDAYVAFLNDYEKNIKAAMDSGNPLKKYYPVSSADYSKDTPTSYSVYDMDGNDIPELIVYGELISHVFTFDGSKVSYVMTVGRLAYKEDGNFASIYQTSSPAEERYHAITVKDGKAKCTKFTTGIVDESGNMKFVMNSRDTDYDGFYKAANLILGDAVAYIPETGKLGTDYEAALSDYSK